MEWYGYMESPGSLGMTQQASKNHAPEYTDFVGGVCGKLYIDSES